MTQETEICFQILPCTLLSWERKRSHCWLQMPFINHQCQEEQSFQKPQWLSHKSDRRSPAALRQFGIAGRREKSGIMGKRVCVSCKTAALCASGEGSHSPRSSTHVCAQRTQALTHPPPPTHTLSHTPGLVVALSFSGALFGFHFIRLIFFFAPATLWQMVL